MGRSGLVALLASDGGPHNVPADVGLVSPSHRGRLVG